MPCKLASEIGLHHRHAIIDCSTIDTANLRNQECAQKSPDPFPRERVGSGHQTTLTLT